VKSVQDDGSLNAVVTRDNGENVDELRPKQGFAAPLEIESTSEATSIILFFTFTHLTNFQLAKKQLLTT
jgi:hypothetical protein